MSEFKKKDNILKIIKYGPLLFVLCLSITITSIVITQKNNFFNQEIRKAENNYLERNKKRVKEEVQRVYDYIKDKKLDSEKLLKQRIKNRVYEAHQIATNIYENELLDRLDGHEHSKRHIFNTIKYALSGIVYNNGRGYIFIDDLNGVKLLQPLNKELEGKNFYDYEDAQGYKFIRKIINTIKNKTEAFDSYYWYKDKNDKQAYEKISFYKYFEPFNVAIGTGEYIDEFEKELQQELIEYIQKIRYEDNSYIFLFDKKGVSLTHYKKEYIGKNRINEKNDKGQYFVKDILNLAEEKGEGFYEYQATINPSTNNMKNSKKVSFIKEFEDWNWVIGTGFYLDKLEQNVSQIKKDLIFSNKKSIEQIIFFSIILTLLFILLSFYISKKLSIMFENYEKDIRDQTSKLIEKENLLIQQSKMATMGEMIGNIAHQWKQPLSLISTSNGMLKLNKEYKNFSEKQLDEAIENIDNSVQNLSETIDDFRNFFNPNKSLSHFKIEHSFDKTFKLIDSQFKNNNIEIIKDVEDIDLYSYENELLQVLINIIKNAKEQLEKLKNDRIKILQISAKKENNTLIIKLIDNGGGIKEENLDKIFDNHFTTKKEEGGSGIGLYMSRQIIQNSLQGEITAYNTTLEYKDYNLKGACFQIKLPLV
ncbi:sensor histidine kinase [Arcobacter roscoffensis]|uniref:histidine kinase n=1 Tax=Arcobacter roscoffensis TaxID=2961520 RepID=A0ABY5E2S4_9BACT|nr:cache domain-containing protein [Arcobacter roscoffensis]UTJ05343.1 cache domain-containing protein [Arcobacter roscoffensis]